MKKSVYFILIIALLLPAAIFAAGAKEQAVDETSRLPSTTGPMTMLPGPSWKMS